MTTNSETFKKEAPGLMQKLISTFGISVEDAAAIAGNAGHESGGFLELKQIGGGDGIGLFQWSGLRHHSFIHFCDQHGLSPWAFNSSVEMLIVELRGQYSFALHMTKAATSLFAKVEAFEHYYERAGVPALRARYQWAEMALEAYHVAYSKPKPES